MPFVQLMTTFTLIVVALLLWFVWRQLEAIAKSLAGLHTIAAEKHDKPQ